MSCMCALKPRKWLARGGSIANGWRTRSLVHCHSFWCSGDETDSCRVSNDARAPICSCIACFKNLIGVELDEAEGDHGGTTTTLGKVMPIGVDAAKALLCCQLL